MSRVGRMFGARQTLAIAVLVAMTACGFQPLYGERTDGRDVTREIAQIAIDPIPDRLGQRVRNHLIDALNAGGQPSAPSFRLAVALTQRKEGVAFQSDEQATRFNVTLEATFALRRAADDVVVTRGAARSVTAFNIVQSEFANITAENDAGRRAARQVADSIALRLGVFFGGQGG